MSGFIGLFRAIRGAMGAPREYRISNIELWVLELQKAGKAHTGAAEDTGHLDELNGLLAGIHLGGLERALSSRVGVGWTEGK